MKKIEVMPGSEFKAAAREAHGIGAAVVLGDRPIDVHSHFTLPLLSLLSLS